MYKKKLLSSFDFYIARLISTPLVVCMLIALMLLLIDKMRRLLDFVAVEGGPIKVVWNMLAFLIPEYLSLGIPIGLLLGILLAFRKLALNSELDVLWSVGQGPGRLLRVPYIFAAVLMISNLALVGFIQPISRYKYEELRFDLRSGALGASIKVGEFNSLGKRLILRIEESQDNGSMLKGIFVNAENKNGQILSVTAQSGQFLVTDDPDAIILRLSQGVLVHRSPNYATPRILSFSSHDLPIDLPDIEAFRTRGGKDTEYTIPELIRIGWDENRSLEERNESRANFHFRIVEVVMMLLMPLLALALAIPPKRTSSALGVFVSVVMIVTYHKINQFSEDVGSLGLVDPAIALWTPFVLFSALIFRMYYIVAYVPGGQPIGKLEAVFQKFGGVFSRIVNFNITRREAQDYPDNST